MRVINHIYQIYTKKSVRIHTFVGKMQKIVLESVGFARSIIPTNVRILRICGHSSLHPLYKCVNPNGLVNIKHLCFLIFNSFIFNLNAQTLQRLNIDFTTSNGILKMPLAGGLNAPQFSPVDLNGDGKQDIFIFDRSGNVRLTFLNNGRGYDYAPQYINNFPELNDWALLRDFNGDGIADIFTYNDGVVSGIRVFKGKMVNGQIGFDRMNFASNGNILSYPINATKTNLYVNSVDIPSIDDIDGDGDLDILAFEVGGGHVYWYKNFSKERNFQRDSLIFELNDRCWGHFYDNGFQAAVKLGSKDTCASSLKGGDGVEVVARHPGATLTSYDRDNDGDKDLLIGSISYENMSDLTNSGTPTQAWISAQDNRFPSNTEGVNLPSFPAAYFLDADNDGKKDVLVSPSSNNFVENLAVSWLYKNTGTNQNPSFILQQKDFLVRDMLDLGAGANPAFIDYDADGLTDLVVGNYSYFKPFNGRDARLFLFKNIGTATQPKFQLIDDNWLNFKALSNIDFVNFSPTFGDMDSDGDLDMLVGEDTGTLFYVENKGGAARPLSMGTPQAIWKNIQAGTSCKPQIVDLNRDGLPDIVTGTRTGILRYFQNIGTRTQPDFSTTATNNFLGKVNVIDLGFATGFAAPQFIDFNGKYRLFVGAENGRISVYDNIEDSLRGTFHLVNPDYGKIRDGWRSTPIVKNINGDAQLEMFIGNFRGGLTAYKTTFNVDGTTGLQNAEYQDFVKFYPNPATDFIYLEIDKNALFSRNFNNNCEIKIVNVMGQIVKKFQGNTRLPVVTAMEQYKLDIVDLTKGIYFIEIKIGNLKQIIRFLKM